VVWWLVSELVSVGLTVCLSDARPTPAFLQKPDHQGS
jgi:hypothetical protein